MKEKLKRIRYVKIVRDIVYIYILCAGIFSSSYAYEIINKGTLPEVYYSLEFFIESVNFFAVVVILSYFCIVIFEIFILGKYRYLKPDCLFYFHCNEDGEPLEYIDVKQVCADLLANEDGCIEGGDGYILLDKAVEIVRTAVKTNDFKGARKRI